ncbi:MAG: nitrate/nitrite transporter NrtS [Anaerolineales bacterium]|nr:nitrate/nitrite transporter NrtS [Anaerolineales bacterium]
MRRATYSALIVGSILILINHSDALLRGELDPTRLYRIALTVIVPYVVSTVSSVIMIQEIRKMNPLPEMNKNE